MENKQIEYKYAEWTVQKELVPKKEGALYKVSPWSLTWDNENYYLIAYDEVTESIKHYRVDKMQQVSVIDKERIGKDKFQHFDLAEFSKKTFGMYWGRDEVVTLVCRNEIAGVILDRFGKDVTLIPRDYSVAAMALGKGEYAIHQSGKWYTNDNIDQMLMERYMAGKARRTSKKNHLKGPKKQVKEDDVRFLESFERMLLEAMREKHQN